jgi:hypothetical protein
MNSRFFDNFFNGGGGESSSNRSLKKFFDIKKSADNLFKDNVEITSVNDIFEYDDTQNITSADYMFYGCTNLTEIPQLNLDNVSNINYAFCGCKSLTSLTLNVGKFVEPKIFNCIGLFQDCSNLKEAYLTIPRISPHLFNTLGNSNGYDMCTNLETLHIYCKNTDGYVYSASLRNLIVTNIHGIFSVRRSGSDETGANLTEESLLGLIKELHIYTGTHYTGMGTLTMGFDNIKKVKNKYPYVRLIDVTDEMREQDQNIDLKYPFEVCESTDEGAITISNYMTMKKYTWN